MHCVFRRLADEVEAGAVYMFFAYTFELPGTFVFASNEARDRLLFVRVVETKEACGERGSGAIFNSSEQVLKEIALETEPVYAVEGADWVAVIFLAVLGILLAGVSILLQRVARLYYWAFPASLKVDDVALLRCGDSAALTPREGPSKSCCLCICNRASPGFVVCRTQELPPWKEALLCCQKTPHEDAVVAEQSMELDPRIFQAIYFKILETQALVSSSVSVLEATEERLVEAQIDSSTPLKSLVMPLLAEASEKKVRRVSPPLPALLRTKREPVVCRHAVRLLISTCLQEWQEFQDAETVSRLHELSELLLLRKGTLQEAVEKAYEALRVLEVRRFPSRQVLGAVFYWLARRREIFIYKYINIYIYISVLASLSAQLEGEGQQLLKKRSSVLLSSAFDDLVQKASLAFISAADLSVDSFAAALGVERSAETSASLRSLVEAQTATETLRSTLAKSGGGGAAVESGPLKINSRVLQASEVRTASDAET